MFASVNPVRHHRNIGGRTLKIAFVIYDDITALDFVGIYDPLTRLKSMGFLPDLAWEICCHTEPVRDSNGLHFTPTKVGGSLASHDMVVVPGGFGSRELVHDAAFLQWLKTAEACKLKVSVCTGSLLLGAAGFLEGKRATTHRSAFDQLRGYCSAVVDDRIVDEDEVVTARGVTSAIDLGLYLCEKFAGRGAAEQIRRQMDYERTGVPTSRDAAR